MLEQLAESTAAHLLPWLERDLDRIPWPIVGAAGWHWEEDSLVLEAKMALRRTV